MQTDRRTIVKDLVVSALLTVFFSAPILYVISKTEPIAYVIMILLVVILAWITFVSFIVMPPQNVVFALFFGFFLSIPINIAFSPCVNDIVEKIVQNIPSLEPRSWEVASLIHLFITFLVYFALLMDSKEIQKKSNANG